MGISKEEVKFGVVPGLAGLAEKLSNAFAHSRNRELDFEIAKLNKGDKDRRAKAAQLEAQRKKEAADEKQRRDTLQSTIKSSDKAINRQGDFHVPGTSINDITQAERDKFGGLGSEKDGERFTAEAQLGMARKMSAMVKAAQKNGNEENLAALTQVQGLLNTGEITIADLGRDFGDNQSFMKNLGDNMMQNQGPLVADSRALAAKLGGADLSHLSPEEQEAVQVKQQALTKDLPGEESDLQPGDIEGQLLNIQKLVEARMINSIPAADYVELKINRKMTDAEKNHVDQVIKDQEDAAAEEIDNGEELQEGEELTPEDRQSMAEDKEKASAEAKKNLVTVMENGISLVDGVAVLKPGTDLNRQQLDREMKDAGVVMTPFKQGVYDRYRGKVLKNRHDLSDRQKDGMARIKAGAPSLPDAVAFAIVKSGSFAELQSLTNKLQHSRIKGGRRSDRLQKLTPADKIFVEKTYEALSLASEPGTLSKENNIRTLGAKMGFKGAQEALRLKEISDANIAQQEEADQAQRDQIRTQSMGGPGPVPQDVATSGMSDADIISRGGFQ